MKTRNVPTEKPTRMLFLVLNRYLQKSEKDILNCRDLTTRRRRNQKKKFPTLVDPKLFNNPCFIEAGYSNCPLLMFQVMQIRFSQRKKNAIYGIALTMC